MEGSQYVDFLFDSKPWAMSEDAPQKDGKCSLEQRRVTAPTVPHMWEVCRVNV